MPEEPIPPCFKLRDDAFEEIIQELEAIKQLTPAATTNANENDGKLLSNIWNILRKKRIKNNYNNNMDVHSNCNHPSTSKIEVKRSNITIEKEKSATTVPNRNIKITVYQASASDKGKNEIYEQGPTCKICKKRQSGSSTKEGSKESIKQTEKEGIDCAAEAEDLEKKQQYLRKQIAKLEEREKKAMRRLKEADTMWAKMENEYKEKMAKEMKKQSDLMQELRIVEDNCRIWRKNTKDVEFQLRTVSKFKDQIKDQMHFKTNDIKVMDKEIAEYKSRLHQANKELENSTNYMAFKKNAADKLTANILREIAKVTKSIEDEHNNKLAREYEGAKFVREAGDDIKDLTTTAKKLKLDRDALTSEKNMLIEEIKVLQENYNNCKDICAKRADSTVEEIKELTTKIAEFEIKCKQCHRYTDTEDIVKCCTDCPRCQATDKSSQNLKPCGCDQAMDCICMSVKRKFLENVFENMHTVLERKADSSAGKAVATLVLNYLKRSVNGKLDSDTRGIVKDFILATIKKNLNLTIVGGAVKTRCEMDSESYKQLMLCLKDVPQPKPPSKNDEPVTKDPCERWGGTKECNCPKGPKDCTCTKKSRPPIHDCSSPDSLDQEFISKTSQKKGTSSKTPDSCCAVAIGKPKYPHVTPGTPTSTKSAPPTPKDGLQMVLAERDDTTQCSQCSHMCCSDRNRAILRQQIVDEVLGDLIDRAPQKHSTEEKKQK